MANRLAVGIVDLQDDYLIFDNADWLCDPVISAKTYDFFLECGLFGLEHKYVVDGEKLVSDTIAFNDLSTRNILDKLIANYLSTINQSRDKLTDEEKATLRDAAAMLTALDYLDSQVDDRESNKPNHNNKSVCILTTR